MAPVLAGLVQYEAIYDTRLSLIDFGRMNDALYVRAENERRMREAAQNGG